MGKQKFNLHTHTARCGHAEGLDIQITSTESDSNNGSVPALFANIPIKDIRNSDK